MLILINKMLNIAFAFFNHIYINVNSMNSFRQISIILILYYLIAIGIANIPSLHPMSNTVLLLK
jgi:hypothetical protein